ncbi:MAG: MBL fold metallo-hydrolase [Anaerovoracaceae bacterium]|nr:MBL fold metallo-hydrolase [Anaerovoracaceae bacterium]
MEFHFCSFASGSSGNCYFIKSKGTVLLVDAGISAKRILLGLEERGTSASDVSAVLITHEHIDHVKGLRVLLKRLGKTPAFANKKTWAHIDSSQFEESCRTFQTGQAFLIGDIEVKPFATIHDAAEPVGYSFISQGKKLSIVTDTGVLKPELLDEISDSDTIVLEANHEEVMLKLGSYPYFLKQRILSEHGHLSNQAAADGICHIMGHGKKQPTILFAHLSRENNRPESVFQTVRQTLADKGYSFQEDSMEVLLSETISLVYKV